MKYRLYMFTSEIIYKIIIMYNTIYTDKSYARYHVGGEQ